MKINRATPDKHKYLHLLGVIPAAPEAIFFKGTLPADRVPTVAIVGTRKPTAYGREVAHQLAYELASKGVIIVSGLALGIDSLAHEAALRHGLYTLAIPGGGLGDFAIYPARHKPLAKKILESGGGLLSEYDPDFRATTWSFPERNRLVAGISHATMVIEAGEKSGSLITARLAADYNRELLVVPGNIFSDNSKGTHQFLKLGATPVTEPSDILNALGIEMKSAETLSVMPALSSEEEVIINILSEPTERDTLIRKSGLSTETASIVLMRMEMNGLILESAGVYRKIV